MKSATVLAHQQGKCAMRAGCGSKGRFGPQLPCPYDGPPVAPESQEFIDVLTNVCGPQFASGPVCCTKDQVEALDANLQQAESIISTCPACRNNFRSFYCTFTCSPDQGSFVNITSTQTTSTGQTAVKSLDFHIGEDFGEGFFNSCKDVKFSAINGYAMDLIGGGAKNYSAFLQYMGDERPGLGSPFQIDFPRPSASPPDGITPLNPVPRSCSDDGLGSRCSCIDCPSVCPVLPGLPAPGSGSVCHVGSISCLSFVLILSYTLAVFAFFTGYGIHFFLRKRKNKGYYERVALGGDTASGHTPSLDSRRGLIGASSLAPMPDGDDSTTIISESRQLGRGASLLEPMDNIQPRHYRLNTTIRRSFYRLGLFCASYPLISLALTMIFVGILNTGWKNFSVETDPVRLWVSPTSETKLQKEFFDANFGPFYRTEQLFITVAPQTTSLPPQNSTELADTTVKKEPVLSWERLKWWFKVEEEIRNLQSPLNGYGLEDVCFKPAGPSGACVVQSIAAWFGNDLGEYDPDTWRDQVVQCANNPSTCLPDFGQPLGPQYVLGGVPDEDQSAGRWLKAEALVVTYVVSDSLDVAVREKAEEWERSLRSYLMDLQAWAPLASGVEIAFSTGVSLEEEINQSTNTDYKIVALSYLVMFFYIAFTLGGSSTTGGGGFLSSLVGWSTRPRAGLDSMSSSRSGAWYPRLSRKLFVGSKFMLGLFGILLVIISVASSVGFFSFAGVKVTLIIAEVIPFLVLAVGVDNVFILVHELDRQNSLHGPGVATPSQRLGNTSETLMSPQSYPSPFTSSSASEDATSQQQQNYQYLAPEERVARTLAKMGPSILLSTITETTAFALGALVPMPAVRNFALYAAGSVFLGAIFQVTAFVSALCLDLRREEASRVDCFPCITLPGRISLPPDGGPPGVDHGAISKFFRRYYAPFLLRKQVKSVVLAAFAGVFVASVISMQHIELGLDQRLALPSGSYLIPYFDALDKYLDIGPPVFFVSSENNVTDRSGQKHLCARFTTCDEYSLANILEGERKRPNVSFISEPAAGWIDDFFQWLDPHIDSCCRVRKNDPKQFCNSRTPSRLCRPCLEGQEPPWNITMQGLPEGEEFMRYLKQWLISPTDDDCPLGGRASYSSAISIKDDTVAATHFRTFHKPLKSQSDFIEAFIAANRIADDISESTGTKVFPYSLFYVFFEQYVHIVSITQEILGLGLAAVLLVTAFLLGSWRTGTIVTGVVALTVVNVMGVMGAWGINLNAISLVNLVISLGIAVEFCSHIARAFMSAGVGLPADHPEGQKERDERMWSALADVGPSVLSGITFTKLIGMSVLALTRSRLLEIYYFRMWLSLIISGALHGLLLLPVVLSFAGGPGFTEVDTDEEWMSSAIRRPDQEYAPFLADTESIHSDS